MCRKERTRHGHIGRKGQRDRRQGTGEGEGVRARVEAVFVGLVQGDGNTTTEKPKQLMMFIFQTETKPKETIINVCNVGEEERKGKFPRIFLTAARQPCKALALALALYE